VSRKRKKRSGRVDPGAGGDAGPEAEAPRSLVSKPVGTGLSSLLEQAGLASMEPPRPPRTLPPPEPAPPSRVPPAAGSVPPGPAPSGWQPRSTADLAAWNQAYAGVRPLAGEKGRRPAARAPRDAPALDPGAEAAARARLAALVGEAQRFSVVWDEGEVRALREGQKPALLDRLQGSGFEPEARIDLHGLLRAEAGARVTAFVRERHRAGLRALLVVVGKGLHSEGGIGVLADAAVEALTRGGAAPLVLAVASAHGRHGGRGALAVVLRS